MRPYLSIFKLRFITNLQYRTAALAGLCTQIFFGLVFIMVYLAFYESGTSDGSMELSQLVTYIWLQQGFYALIYLYYKDKEVINMIKSGDVAYELCRPQNIYFKWYARIYASKLADVLLRFMPLLTFAFLIPSPIKLSLPYSYLSLTLFVIALIMSSFLVTAVITLYHVLTFYTLESDGVMGMFVTVSEVFSGAIVPLPFFPAFLKKVADILPFHYIADFPFRVYSGNIPSNECYTLLLQESIWIIVIITIGYLLTKNAIKKIIVQGG